MSDALTRLPNRRLLVDRLGAAIRRQGRNSNERYALLYLDLDDFKLINDDRGHAVGDRLLIEIGRRLEASVRDTDTVARLGGDEFAVLLELLVQEDDVFQICDKLIASISEPMTIDGQEIVISTSIGVALGSTIYRTEEKILCDADTALYKAKKLGRNRYVLFDQQMHEDFIRCAQVKSELQWGVRNREFEVFYQPIVNAHDHSLVGFECLVRWHHPKRGLVYPGEFISLLEGCGLIKDLGLWILATSCAQLRAWENEDPNFASRFISCNVSLLLFSDIGLVNEINEIITNSGIRPDQLRIEITETDMVTDPEKSNAILSALRELGVHISLDDFGTGYSSLSHLRIFPIDSIKIDNSFVYKSVSNKRDQEILRAIVKLAHNLDLTVVAEGVEGPQEAALMRDFGCEQLQGFFFARALTADQALSFATCKNEAIAVKSCPAASFPIVSVPDALSRREDEQKKYKLTLQRALTIVTDTAVRFWKQESPNEIVLGSTLDVTPETMTNSITATILYRGERDGIIAVVCPVGAATMLAEQMNGLANGGQAEIAHQELANDVVKEFCNVVAGAAARALPFKNIVIAPPCTGWPDATKSFAVMTVWARASIAWRGYSIEIGIGLFPMIVFPQVA